MVDNSRGLWDEQFIYCCTTVLDDLLPGSRRQGQSKGTVKFLNFLDTRKLRCNLPKIQTKRPNLRVFHQIDSNGIANSEYPDQTAPLGAV